VCSGLEYLLTTLNSPADSDCSSNTNEGAGWSAGLPDQSANTANANVTETTVFNFLSGQWIPFTRTSFNHGLDLYPLTDFGGSFDLQGQQMYGEARYICTAGLITAGATAAGLDAYQYQYVQQFPLAL